MNKRVLRLFAVIGLLSGSYWITLWFHNLSPTGVDLASSPSGEEPSPGVEVMDAPERLADPEVLANNNNSSSSMRPCPPSPPGLVGPLRIEFDWKRTMTDVLRESAMDLQEGGRYKPLDCVSQHKVAIIVPYRSRQEHLKHWLYYLHPILKRQQLDYGVYIIHQYGNGTFNRAKLLNVGFVESLKEYGYTCFVFSDVDLVPMDDRNLYRCYPEPRHMAAAMDKFGYALPYRTYFGGVVSFSKAQYLLINGFPNQYWGWGAEDDDMYKRIVLRKMGVSRPDARVGKYKMVRHRRDAHNEENPKNSAQLHHTGRTMDSDGINTLTYTVKNIIKNKLYTMVVVDINAPQ